MFGNEPLSGQGTPAQEVQQKEIIKLLADILAELCKISRDMETIRMRISF